jgi:hypothetical protein
MSLEERPHLNRVKRRDFLLLSGRASALIFTGLLVGCNGSKNGNTPPPSPGTVAAPTFSLSPGTYSGTQTLTITSSTDGTTIHYTTNGSTPTTGSPSIPNGGTITVASSLTLKAIAVKSGMNSSTENVATYTIQPVGAVQSPTFTPDGGAFIGVQNTVVTCATPGATIHFTTDGSTPTTNSPIVPNGGTVPISMSLTLKAIGVKPGLNDSAVKSATYTIQEPAMQKTIVITSSSRFYDVDFTNALVLKDDNKQIRLVQSDTALFDGNADTVLLGGPVTAFTVGKNKVAVSSPTGAAVKAEVILEIPAGTAVLRGEVRAIDGQITIQVKGGGVQTLSAASEFALNA